MSNKKIYSIRRSISCVFCFKQLSLSTKEKFESLYHLINRETLLSLEVGVVRFSADEPLHFHDTTFSVLPSIFKV